jgi:ATP-dependent RNA helicase DeaD
MLRTIEQLTRQKIEVETIPTVADLRARRLELTRASVRERLVAGGFDDVRAVVEALAEEFDLFDVAAAAIALAHEELRGDGDEEIEAVGRPSSGAPPAPRTSQRPREAGDMTRLFIGAGRRAGIRPGDLVGAITGEAGVRSSELGAIEIADSFSLIEVPERLADAIIGAMKKSSLRGQKVTVRRDRDA